MDVTEQIRQATADAVPRQVPCPECGQVLVPVSVAPSVGGNVWLLLCPHDITRWSYRKVS